MKIIQILDSLDCGGHEKMLISLAVAFKGKGHACQIVCISHKGTLALQAENKGIKVTALGQKWGFSLLALCRLCWLLIVDRPDILHLHNHRPLIYGALAARLLHIKCAFTRHGSGSLIAPPWIWASVSKNIAISLQAKEDLLKQNPCLKEADVPVVLNGVNIKDFDIWLDNVKDKADCLMVGHVARLSPEKGQQTLLKSFALVVKEMGNRPVRLVIAGDGPERARLEKSAADLGIAGQVDFLGFKENIAEIMHKFDVFVLSSLTEGVSLTLLEAMAASKPVVATQVGGNPEVVANFETGFLVPPKDSAAMAEKILALLNDQDMARKMGAAGRVRVEEFFSLEKMTDTYEKIYGFI